MKDQKEQSKMLSFRVPDSVMKELDETAKNNNRTRSEEALYRIKHYPVPLTPSLMYELENAKNKKYGDLKPDMPPEAIQIYEEVVLLWRRLK